MSFSPKAMLERDRNAPIIDMNFSLIRDYVKFSSSRIDKIFSIINSTAPLPSSSSASECVILAPSASGRNTIYPTSTGIEAITLKGYDKNSLISSSSWDAAGAGLIFSGTTIADDTTTTNSHTSYAYKAIPNLSGLVVKAFYTMRGDGQNRSQALSSCNCGIGICQSNVNTAIAPSSDTKGGAGSWLPYGTSSGTPARHFGWNNYNAYSVGDISLNTTYSFNTTLTVGIKKGNNNYDLTIRTIVHRVSGSGAILDLDYSQTITDAIVNGTETNGFIVISGNDSFTHLYSVASFYSISSIIYYLSSGNALQVTDTSNNVLSYIDWVGNASFNSLVSLETSALGIVSSGVWQGASISTAYTDAKVKTVNGTANRITIGGTASDPTFNISTAYAGQNTITTLGIIANLSATLSTFGGTTDATSAATGTIICSGGIGLSKTLYTASNIKLGTAGNGIYIKEGANATMGVATLVLGTVVVNTTKVTANSRIFLTSNNLGTITAPVGVAVSARTAGTSFTILSGNLTDTSTIGWLIMEPA